MAETTQQNEQGFKAFVRVLRNRNFFWLWFAQLISMIGDFFAFLAVPLMIMALMEGIDVGHAAEASELAAETKTMIGISTLAFSLPRLAGLFTGAFVDRWDRQRTIVIASLIASGIMLLPMLVNSEADIWLLIIMQFLLALITRFIQPAQSAVIPLLVDEDDLLAANGLSTFNMTIGIIIGPALAGLTVTYLGLKAAFIFDSLTFLVAGLVIQLFVRVPELENPPTGEGFRAILGNIWEGLRFIMVTPLLLTTVLCFCLLQGGLGGINAMWVPFLRETFGVGATGITVVDMIQGGGMVVGGLLLGIMMTRLGLYAIAAGGLIGLGVSILAIGLAPSYIFVLIISFVLGVLLTPFDAAFSTIMQKAVPKELLGRVFGSFMAITQTASVLILSLVTAAMATIPLRAIFLAGGILTVLAGVIWAISVRDDVRAMEQASHTAQPAKTIQPSEPAPAGTAK